MNLYLGPVPLKPGRRHCGYCWGYGLKPAEGARCQHKRCEDCEGRGDRAEYSWERKR